MYNLRYHVASLVAVFLALTVGLVLGTVVAERGTFDDQSARLVEGLQQQFSELQEENTALKATLDRDALFMSDTMPLLLSGRLAGKNVAVLTNAGRSNGLTALVSAIEAAGATPVTYTFEEVDLGLATRIPVDLPVLLGGQFADDAMAPASDAFEQALAEGLAGEWSRTASGPLTEALVSAGVLSVRGAEADTRLDAFVLMVAFGGEPDVLAATVAEMLGARGSVVVGAESSTQATGVAGEAVDRGLSAVDHVETPQGALSVVWLLSGASRGYFGLGEGAQAAYPKPIPGQE